MPEVNHVYVYSNTQPPVAIISDATAHRTLPGSYTDVRGRMTGDIVVGLQYRITEGGPYDATTRPGVIKYCTSINADTRAEFTDDPPGQ
jgi:hypothetical protein